jgi:hypothetical protein
MTGNEDACRKACSLPQPAELLVSDHLAGIATDRTKYAPAMLQTVHLQGTCICKCRAQA